jgi:ATP-dependent DNA ligase
MHSEDQIHYKECPQRHQPILSFHRITTDVTTDWLHEVKYDGYRLGWSATVTV